MQNVTTKLYELDVPYDLYMTAVEMKINLKDWINENVKPEIVTLTENDGHKVIFTLPYHSDIQPIEMLWVLVNGKNSRITVEQKDDAEKCEDSMVPRSWESSNSRMKCVDWDHHL